MNQHFPSRKTSRRSGPASSPPGQPQTAGPLPRAQRRGAHRAPSHSREAVWPRRPLRGELGFSLPHPGVCSRSSPAASSFLLSAVPAGAAAAVRAARCRTRGARARTGSVTADPPLSAGIPAGQRPCREMSPRGTGLCPATTHPCAQVTSHATLGCTAHRGAPAHGDWLLPQNKVKLN